jgi:hypothetical protein
MKILIIDDDPTSLKLTSVKPINTRTLLQQIEEVVARKSEVSAAPIRL